MKLFALALLAVVPMFAESNLLTAKLDPHKVTPFVLSDGAVLIVSVADASQFPAFPAGVKPERPRWVWFAISNPQQARYWIVVNQDFAHPVLVEALMLTGMLSAMRPMPEDITDLRALSQMEVK